MLLILTVLLAASPPPPIKGFDKPKKEERGVLGESELAKGKVKIYCADVGRWMLVEVTDPGLKGARDVWLRKKIGEAMPPCEASESGVTRLEGAATYGYVAGVKGHFVFVTSADGASDRRGVRVYSLVDGAEVYTAELSTQFPATVTSDGKTTVLRFHLGIHARCEPLGDDASSCWKEIKEGANIPAQVAVEPPPCEALLKRHPDRMGIQVAVPAEVDLSSPKVVKFTAGPATCTFAE